MCSARNSISLKISGSGSKLDERAVRFLGALPFSSLLELALLEATPRRIRPSRWLRTRNSLDSALTALVPTPFKPDAELEHVVVVFGAGVDLGDAIDHFAQRDAAAEIAHGDVVVLDADLRPPCRSP